MSQGTRRGMNVLDGFPDLLNMGATKDKDLDDAGAGQALERPV